MQHKKIKKKSFRALQEKADSENWCWDKDKRENPFKDKTFEKKKKNHKMRKKGGGRNDGDWEKNWNILEK